MAWNGGMWVEGISRGEGLSRKQPGCRAQDTTVKRAFR